MDLNLCTGGPSHWNRRDPSWNCCRKVGSLHWIVWIQAQILKTSPNLIYLHQLCILLGRILLALAKPTFRLPLKCNSPLLKTHFHCCRDQMQHALHHYGLCSALLVVMSGLWSSSCTVLVLMFHPEAVWNSEWCNRGYPLSLQSSASLGSLQLHGLDLVEMLPFHTASTHTRADLTGQTCPKLSCDLRSLRSSVYSNQECSWNPFHTCDSYVYIFWPYMIIVWLTDLYYVIIHRTVQTETISVWMGRGNLI